MPNNTILSEDEFIVLFREHGASELARQYNLSLSGVFERRARIEKKLGILLRRDNRPSFTPSDFPERIKLEVYDGFVIVGSDCHYWPSQTPPLMHRAFVAAIKEYKPKAVVLNGDVIDAPRISKHAPIGWEKRPELVDEIENAQERCFEIEQAAGRADKVWTLGNHDARFESKIALVAPEYAKIHGVHLKDHFPLWRPGWMSYINDDIVVKHRFKGGIHATHNNTLWAGMTMITGHLHSAKVTPFTDYRGTRYGVDGGCIADPRHRAFIDYTEDNPKNWRAGFVLLTFKGGKLLMPELVTQWDDERVQFRGNVFAP